MYLLKNDLAQMNELSHWMNNLLSNGVFDRPTRRSTNLAADLLEGEQSYYIRAELPGFAKEEVRLEVVQDTLVLHAEKKQGNNTTTIQRTIRLPENTDNSNASAKLENGILLVTFHKKPENNPQLIAIA